MAIVFPLYTPGKVNTSILTIDNSMENIILYIYFAKLHNQYLSVSNHTNDLAVLLHLLEIAFDLFLSPVIRPFFGVFGESLLLAGVPFAPRSM